MTQGEILSAIAPIESVIGILNRMKGKRIGINEVNRTMPFINRAQKAAEKISRFALDNFNSIDANKRELADVVYYRFKGFSSLFDDIEDFRSRTDETSVEYINNHIQSIKDIIDNTVEVVVNFKDVLPPPDNNKGDKQSSSVNSTVQYIVDNLTIQNQNEEPAKTEPDVNCQEDEEEYEDSYEDDVAEGEKDMGDNQLVELYNLADAQKTIEGQAQTIDELRAEIARLKEAKDSTKSDEQYNIEIKRLKGVHEDTLVTLLKPAFFNIEDDARDFLKRIQGLDNQGVTDVVRQFIDDRKITPSKKGRFIWNILTAAKLYTCVEQNWTAALRKDD